MVRFLRPEGMTRWQWMIQRFWEGVDKRGPNDCWPWTKARVTDGYGTIAYEVGDLYATHRLSFIIEHGNIPEGMQVLHSCDNPPCCNPAHLFLGTNLDNVRDMLNKRRGSVKLTCEQVKQIKEDFRKQRIIAEEYNISQSLVSRIKRGNRWHEW